MYTIFCWEFWAFANALLTLMIFVACSFHYNVGNSNTVATIALACLIKRTQSTRCVMRRTIFCLLSRSLFSFATIASRDNSAAKMMRMANKWCEIMWMLVCFSLLLRLVEALRQMCQAWWEGVKVAQQTSVKCASTIPTEWLEIMISGEYGQMFHGRDKNNHTWVDETFPRKFSKINRWKFLVGIHVKAVQNSPPCPWSCICSQISLLLLKCIFFLIFHTTFLVPSLNCTLYCVPTTYTSYNVSYYS